jgi:predicted N-acetyltransferase YhbS
MLAIRAEETADHARVFEIQTAAFERRNEADLVEIPMGFTYGSPLFDPALQVHEFSEGILGGNGGRVRFHPAFAETGCG